MRNYYNLKKQLDLCLMYLESLMEQKELLNSFLSPKGVNYGSVAVQERKKTDPFATYAHNSINLDKQIAAVKMEIEILQRNLKRMDEMLRDVNNNKYKIFVYRYLDGLSTVEIAKKTSFSTRRVYQILKEIEEILDF